MTLEDILQTLPDLSAADKLQLKRALERDLGSSAANGTHNSSPLIGLMKDKPQLMDEIVADAYLLRSLPLRLPADG